MKAESNIKPSALSVEECAGDIAEVIFRENITSEQRDEETFYSYDEYRTAVPYRENLLKSVIKNKQAWFDRAIQEEKLTEKNGISLYSEKVNSLVREKYSIEAELAIQRQRDTKPDEFKAYYDYVEEVKTKAKSVIERN